MRGRFHGTLSMTHRADAVAIFLDEEELGQMLDGWPEGFRLAVCLDDDGGCAFLVHHRDEDSRVLARVGEALNRPVGGFAVVPARAGLPTRRMLFSEERKLMSLVAESAELRESAADYALNYAFATEEGLDVEAVVAGRARRAGPARPVPVAPASSPAMTAMARPIRPEPEAPPRFTTISAPDPAPAPRPAPALAPLPADLPPGFHPLAPAARRASIFADALLSLGRSGEVWLTIGAPHPGAPALQVTEVYFRADLQSFAIPTAVIAAEGPLPARLSLAEELLPAALVAALSRAPQQVRLTASGAHLFVGLAPGRTERPAVPAAQQPRNLAPRNLRRRILRGGLGGGALAAALLLALQVGLSPAFSGTDHPRKSLRDAIFATLDK
ncbi:hypothetical protein [Acidimangrovimonas sediminis]|uniref:hypothetical protein n=1 Tax=Acidimangrovimonas sediminis TaxID=2056283 RepID=UPI000C80C632|nr:hypothetical protein [Acidimangrovimonas sediminis]